MKICATCQRKYADSLQYCLEDGTVLTQLDDPQATLRLEARPTQSSTPAKRSFVALFALAGIALVGIVGAVAFIALYLSWSNKAADSNRPNSPALSTTNTSQASNSQLSAKDEVAQKLEQVDADVGLASLHSDLAALDRVLADDYRYSNNRGLLLTKQQTLNAYRAGYVRYDYLTTADRKVEVGSDLSRGVVNGRASSKVWFYGRLFTDNDYSYSNTYEMRQDRWQLVKCQVWYR